MLNENIKSFRKKKDLSQEELAIKLNVVRQTVSKWELGLSVPDAEMLIKLADVLETSINTLLGETNQTEPDITSIEEISHKLELLTVQFAEHNEKHRKKTMVSLIILLIIVLFFVVQSFIAVCFACLSVDVSANVEITETIDGMNPSIGIIGGADGPTAILIATTGFPWFELTFLFLGIVAAVLIIVGICKTKRKNSN